MDGEAGTQLGFENVLVLYAATDYTADLYTLSINLTGQGSGYFACGGKIVPITWQRSGEDGMFFYYLADGTPLTLKVGKTYVSVVPQGSDVSCE